MDAVAWAYKEKIPVIVMTALPGSTEDSVDGHVNEDTQPSMATQELRPAITCITPSGRPQIQPHV